MNERRPDTTTLDQATLDRLADGELPDTDRRALLESLDAAPDGWKRCALAFLEAQTWRQSIQNVAAACVPVDGDAMQPQHRAPARHQRGWSLARIGAVAAGVAITFAAGWLMANALDGNGAPSTRMVNKHAPATDGDAHANDRRPPSAKTDADTVRTVAYVEVPAKANGQTLSYRVPIVAGPGVDATWLNTDAYEPDQLVVQRMARQGYELRRQRQTISVALDDGKRVVIPVERIQWAFVGHRAH